MRDTIITIPQIAYKNMLHKPTRAVGLVLLSGILSFLLFGGSIFTISLHNGMDSMRDRLGADLLVVPIENDSEMEAILLKGEPSCFYLDKSVADKVAQVDGVEAVTSQFFLTSISAECCTIPVQLIGFDPDTDFSVTPWISKVYNGEIEDGTVIIGSDIDTKGEDYIKFYGQEYKIAARLEKTGTGLDQAVYSTMNTIGEMYQNAIKKGQYFLEDTDPEKSISSVLVRVEENADKSTVAKNIKKELNHSVTVVETQNMISAVKVQLEAFSSVIKIFIIVFSVIALIALYLVFTISFSERKKEFATLRIMGATRQKVISILLLEALYISFLGAVSGMVVASVVIFPFNVYIGDLLGLPFIHPSLFVIIAMILIDLVVISVAGPLASAKAAWKAGNAESYLVMRDGE